jgi:hypothetical protein
MLTGGEVSRGVDGDSRRQQEIVLVLFDHPDWIPMSVCRIPRFGYNAGKCWRTRKRMREFVQKGSLNVLRVTNVPGARCYKFLVRQNGQAFAFGSTILPFLSGARADA